jgi:hypothetical protein
MSANTKAAPRCFTFAGADPGINQRLLMFARLSTYLVALSLLILSGCAVNRATATVDSSANLLNVKRVHVVKVKEDERGINQLIADRFTQLGITATTSPEKVAGVDAVVTYVDKWMWDITMYMLELTVVMRDPATDFPLATGNSFHTSLTRKSPKEMVDEVTTNIYKGVKP